MNDHDDNPDRSGASWAWWLVVGLLLYVLSPAPLGLMISHVLVPDEMADYVVEPLLAPLEFLYNNVDLVADFYDWYVTFWVS